MASKLFLALTTGNKSLTYMDAAREFHIDGFVKALIRSLKVKDPGFNPEARLKKLEQPLVRSNQELVDDDSDSGEDQQLIEMAEDFVKSYISNDLEAQSEIKQLSLHKKKNKQGVMHKLLSSLLHMGHLGLRVVFFIVRRVLAIITDLIISAIRVITLTFWRFVARPLIMFMLDLLMSPVGMAVAAGLALAGVGYLAYKSYSGSEEPSTTPGALGTSTESTKVKGYTTETESQSMKDAINTVSQQTGVSAGTLTAIGYVESRLDPTRDNPAPGATAGGPFQFINSTWANIKRKYGARYGIPANADKHDPLYASRGEAAFIQMEIIPAIKKVKQSITTTDIYLGHFLGPAGAVKFLSHLKNNPKEAAASVTPTAAKWNPNYYYDKSKRARSLQQMYDLLTAKLTPGASTFALPSKMEVETASLRKTVQKSNTPKSGFDPKQVVPTKTKQPIQGFFPIQNLIVSY